MESFVEKLEERQNYTLMSIFTIQLAASIKEFA